MYFPFWFIDRFWMVLTCILMVFREGKSTALLIIIQVRIQDFKLEGGGALKKIAPSGERRENFWGISCEKSRFYAKKSYFFQLRREARKFWRYFVWKITIFRQKIIFFPILGGGGLGARAGCAPWIRPFHKYTRALHYTKIHEKFEDTKRGKQNP
jgi:hypothetical protein